MDLYKEILANFLEQEEIPITFPNLKLDAKSIAEPESFKTLKKIKAILENDSLDDEQCFIKIKEIICIFESLGSNGGTRHDFG